MLKATQHLPIGILDQFTGIREKEWIMATLADRYQITHAASAGVIAALSPGLRWDLNISHAETLIAEWRARTPRKRMSLVGTYGRRNVDKSLAILKGKAPLDVLGGNKVRACVTTIAW